MFRKTHELSFKFLNVGGGDAIWIRFLGNDLKWHNVLIDGGYGYTYKYAFAPLLKNLDDDECIDLWIISHVDIDHIGAVLGFVNDKRIADKPGTVHKFWFNHSPQKVSDGNGKLGVYQGIELRNYLENNNLLINESITSALSPIDLFGLKITVISPSVEKQVVAGDLWKAKEKVRKIGRTAKEADHIKKIEELVNDEFSEDTDPWNGSSIACLIEFKDKKAILLADSHPSVVVESLTKLCVTPDSPINACFVQLAHHGSKANTSFDLLTLVKSTTFVVTGNGVTNQHPDKETLVRVLTQKGRSADRLEFIFPSITNASTNLFGVDQDPFERYNFRCKYLESGNNQISLEFFPINQANND